MSLVSRKINADEEIQSLKKKYKDLYGKSTPSFSWEYFSTIEENKRVLKQQVEKASTKNRCFFL
jgi:hypothetical protein